MQVFGKRKNIVQNPKQRNYLGHLRSHENIALSTPSQSEKLKKALEQLLPLPGVTILGPDDLQNDSKRFISPDSPRRTIEIAMLQLQYQHDEKPDSKRPVFDLIVNNNLGCAYALLGRYKEAKRILQEATDTTNPKYKSLANSLAFEAAENNLEIVNNIIEGL